MGYRNRKRPEGLLKVRDIRQEQVTGTVADISALVPPRPDTDDITLAAPEEVVTRLPKYAVRAAIKFIDKTDIAPFVDAKYTQGKTKAGRPCVLSTRALLVGMQLAVRDSRPLLVTEIATILYRRLSPKMQRLIGIEPEPRPLNSAAAARWDKRNSARVRRAFHRLLSPVDPSVMPKNRNMLCDQAAQLKKDLSVDEQQQRAIDLDWVCNQLLEAAYQQLPQPVRDRHQDRTPAYCIDGTPLPAFARGENLDSDYISADPDAGYYVREGGHADPDEKNNKETTRTTPTKTPRNGKNGTTTKTTKIVKRVWGREVHLLITADASHPKRLYMPAIPLAFTTDIPGKDPAGAARRIFGNMRDRQHTPGTLAGDILYTNQEASKFQTPAREEGYDLVLGYGVDQLGVQGTHESGALLLDGTYVAPCIPKDLIDLHTALREKRITHAEFKAGIQARVEYKMRTKEKPDPARGIKERLTCPAAGPNPTAMCALKPKSMEPRPTRQPDGAVVDVRRVIDHTRVLTDRKPPKVCQRETITLTPEDGAKYRQTRLFGSDEHYTLYHRSRQSQEGVHGTAKDEAGVALANPGRRRVRGWAAQQVFAAFLMAETATRRIYTFLRDAVPDRNGDLYVLRRQPKDKVRTNIGSPGSPPIFADDPPEAA